MNACNAWTRTETQVQMYIYPITSARTAGNTAAGLVGVHNEEELRAALIPSTVSAAQSLRGIFRRIKGSVNNRPRHDLLTSHSVPCCCLRIGLSPACAAPRGSGAGGKSARESRVLGSVRENGCLAILPLSKSSSPLIVRSRAQDSRRYCPAGLAPALRAVLIRILNNRG